MRQGRRAAGGLDSFASNSSLDSLEFTQLSGDSEQGVSHMEPNIKKFVKECLNINGVVVQLPLIGVYRTPM